MNGNAFEAFFGAIYLDRGYEYCMSFARDVIFKKYINIEEVSKTEENYKSKLIEWCQKYQFEFKFDIVSQKILQDRNTPKFVSRVTIEGVYCGTGDGYSKKESHQKAAQQAYKHIRRNAAFVNTLIDARSKRAEVQNQKED
jgi:ribonuclease-3